MTTEEVNELYKLAGHTLKKHKRMPDEDLVQELVFYAYTRLGEYDETRASKSTFIITCMESKLHMLDREKRAKKRNNGLINYSLEAEIPGNEQISLIDMIASDIDIAEEVNKQDVLEKILPLVKEPLALLLKGLTQKEIAEKLGYSQTNISRLIKQNIESIKSYCKRHDLTI